MEKRRLDIIWKLAVLAAILLGVWAFFKYLFPIISPFLLAMLLAHMIEPIVKRLTKSLRLPRPLSAGLLTLLLIGGLATGLVFLGIWIVSEISGLISHLPTWGNELARLTGEWKDTLELWINAAPLSMQSFLDSSLNRIFSEGFTIPNETYTKLVGWVSSMAGAFPGIVLFCVAMVLSTYFISADYPGITKWLIRKLPHKLRDRFFQTKSHLGGSIGKWLRAQGIMMCITFVELSAGLLILRIPYAIVIAIVTAMLDALPVVGIGLVLLPWAAFSLVTGAKWTALGLLVIYAVANLVRSLVEPRLVGRQLGLNPLVTLIAMYVGFRTTGFLGMILFPILTITLKQMYDWGWFDFFFPNRERSAMENKSNPEEKPDNPPPTA